jgi:serine/threonine-protein kinase
MEYIDGASAQALLDHFGQLPVPEAVRIILDAGRGLEHAHSRNVIHRDIKPDNILLTRTGVVKLADLGLAKRVDEASHLTAARQGFGTPHYMPYEQAVNARNADGRSDIYALGATLYHLVTGEVPFRAPSQVEVVEKKKEGNYPPPSQLNPDVPPVLEKILRKMLAPDPRSRYQTVHDLIADLEQTNLAAPALRSVERLLISVNGQEDPDSGVGDAQPTVADLASAMAGAGRPTPVTPGDPPSGESGIAPLGQDVWYIRFRDSSGQLLKTRASTRQVRKRLAEGRLPVDAEAARSLQGEFKPLSSYPELLPEEGTARVLTEAEPSDLVSPAQGRRESRQATPTTDLEPSWSWFEPTGRPTWCFYLAVGMILAIVTIVGVVIKVLLGV